MADSIAPVTIGPDWTDLYAATGFPVGAPLLIVPIGNAGDVRIAISATKPTDQVGTKVPFGKEAVIDGEQSGAWANSSGGTAVVYVQENTAGAVRLSPFSDSRIIDGNKSITVQPYTELNIKNGLQFYIRASWPLADTISAGSTRKLHFAFGNKTILVKRRIFDYISEELQIVVSANPTGVSGGTGLTVRNWNAKTPQTSIATVTKGVTTTSDGTPIDDPEYFFGGGATGQRIQSSIPEGYERVIPPNSEYIVAITNTSTSTARAQYALTWYEGEISTEIP